MPEINSIKVNGTSYSLGGGSKERIYLLPTAANDKAYISSLEYWVSSYNTAYNGSNYIVYDKGILLRGNQAWRIYITNTNKIINTAISSNDEAQNFFFNNIFQGGGGYSYQRYDSSYPLKCIHRSNDNTIYFELHNASESGNNCLFVSWWYEK